MTAVFQSNIFQHTVFQVGGSTPIVAGPASNDIFLCPVPAFSNHADIRLEDPTKKCGGGIGWMPEWGTGRPRFRHDPRELDRRIRAQRGFGPQRYAQLLEEVATKAREAKNKAQRKALKAALESAKLVDIESQAIDPAPLLLAIEEVATIKRVKESLEAARHAEAMARAYYEFELEQDEEEALVLLLN
jgi:hypothetical protein